MPKTNSKTIIFADNFDIRLVVDSVHLPSCNNLEAYLNLPKDNEELILGGVDVYKRKDAEKGILKGVDIYKRRFKLLTRVPAQTVKTSHIVMVCGTDNQKIYAPPEHGKTFRFPLKFRLEGLERGLIGEVKLFGDKQEVRDSNMIEQLGYINTQLTDKRFIKLYNPHQNPEQDEFTNLFRFGINPVDKSFLSRTLKKVLLNRTDSSVFAKEIPPYINALLSHLNVYY